MKYKKNTDYEKIADTILNSEPFLRISKKMIRLIGIEPAIFLSDLDSKKKYFNKKNQLKKGWFFNTQENRKIDTGIPYHHQTKILKILVGKKLIDVKREGLPARQYFKINYKNIAKLLRKKEKKIHP